MNLQQSQITASEAAKELLRRREARKDLQSFIRFINDEYIVSDFSKEVCASLDQFLIDMLDGKRPILILAAPPQHGKSDIVSRYFPAYVLGRYPSLKLAGLSYAMSLASNMNRDVQRIMMTNEYATLFPDSSLNSKRAVNVVDDQAKRNSEEFEIVGNTGSYIGQGVGGPLTGKRVDLGIIDDPIKNAKEALSGTVKEGVWNWYTSTFLTRLSKNSGQIIMATRWATDDLSGRVLEKYSDRAKNLIFSAISDDNKALVPDLHPLEKLLETKATLGDYFWSAMYQQSPKTIGGAIFKDGCVGFYLPRDLPSSFDQVIQSWDMTFKDGEGTDYVVGQVWGKKGANAYLLDQVRERMGFTASKQAVINMRAKYPEARIILIEDKANGPAIIDSLKTTVSGITPVTPDGSKIARAHAMTGEWEAGNIYFPHSDIKDWSEPLLERVTTFPACSHDDEIDAMTQAVRYLYDNAKRSAYTSKRFF